MERYCGICRKRNENDLTDEYSHGVCLEKARNCFRCLVIFVASKKYTVECPEPPKPLSFPIGSRRSEGYELVGSIVVVDEFSDSWQTGYVTMRGLPNALCCNVAEFKRYCARLHELLMKAYADLGISIPQWRSWDSYAAKWPCLRNEKTRRVHVVKPLE